MGRRRGMQLAVLGAVLAAGTGWALAAGSPPAGAAPPCAAAPVPGSSTVAISSGGLERTALVHVPPGIPAGRRVPLLLALHGYHGTGPFMQRYSGLSATADRHGFVVAYPSSYISYWNSTAARGLPNDVAFLSALIGELERSICIDPERVFATGVSNGGGMVALLGCERSAQIAAIAPVAGGYGKQPPCDPAQPVSVLEIHGTADQDVSYFGESGRRTKNGLPPFVNAWARRDRCRAVPRSRAIATRTTLFTFGGCTAGVVVEHIRIRDGRHQWPGATPPDPGPPATICTSCTVWSFFSALGPRTRAWSARAVGQSSQ
jgi:polyhydroxybutyrate depolymerase